MFVSILCVVSQGWRMQVCVGKRKGDTKSKKVTLLSTTRMHLSGDGTHALIQTAVRCNVTLLAAVDRHTGSSTRIIMDLLHWGFYHGCWPRRVEGGEKRVLSVESSWSGTFRRFIVYKCLLRASWCFVVHYRRSFFVTIASCIQCCVHLHQRVVSCRVSTSQ